MMKRIVGIGFIGCGDISTLHAKAIRRTKNCELVGVWNRRENDISASGVEINVEQRAALFDCRVFSSLQELLECGDISLVYVLTPFEVHKEYALLALKAGKHVFVEKPVATCVEEIEELENCARLHKVLCIPGHNYIYEPQMNRIRRLIHEKSLGDIVHVNVHYNIHHGPEITSKLPDIRKQIMTHHAYVCLFLLSGGDFPVSISAMGSSINNNGGEDNVSMVMLRMKGGAMVLMQASFANDDHSSEPWTFYVKVMGTLGSARYSYNDTIVTSRDTIHSHTYNSFGFSVENICDYVVNRCILGGEEPLSTLSDAKKCLKMLQCAEESIQSQQHVLCNL